MTDRTVQKDHLDSETVDEASQISDTFDQLYLQHVQSVFRYLYSRLGNRADAEDATAETFLAALNGFASYRHKGYFSAWLFSIARHKAADIFRNNRNLTNLNDTTNVIDTENEDILQNVIQNQRKKALINLIDSLPENEQDLLKLRFIAGLSYSEIGQVLKRSEGAVKKAIYRLLARLESQLEDFHE